jgi:hypothetical protein
MEYTGDNLKQLLTKFPLVHKEDAHYIHLQECPFCRACDYNFHYDKEQDVLRCDACGVIKNIWEFQKKLGLISDISPLLDAISTRLKMDPNAGVDPTLISHVVGNLQKDTELLARLKSQFGISAETLEAYKIGYKSNHLVVTYWHDDRCMKLKFMNLGYGMSSYFSPPEADGLHILFNQHNCLKHDSIILCEKEMDALVLLDYGVRHVVAFPDAVHRFYPEWFDFLNKKSKIVLLFRNTPAGDHTARKLARQLGYEKVIPVKLPEAAGKEAVMLPVVEYMKAHTWEEMEKLLTESPPYHIENIVSITDAADVLEEKLLAREKGEGKDDRKIRTPWDGLEELYGGLYGGRMVIVSGVPKVGKTTFALDICRYNAKREHPVLHFCVEMQPDILTQKMLASEMQKPFAQIMSGDVQDFRKKYTYFPMYFGHRPMAFDVDSVFRVLEQAIPRYGLELVVFDHLHFLCRTDKDTSQLVSLTSQRFKMLAEAFNIPIILLAQPRKLRDDMPPTANDLKDSVSLWQDADDIIIVHRDRLPLQMEDSQSTLSDETLVRVDASRLAPGGQIKLYFHTAYSTFVTPKEYEAMQQARFQESQPKTASDDAFTGEDETAF